MNEPKFTKADLINLATLRDELKLQIHLFDAEARQRWEEIEKDWQLIRSEIEGLKPVAARAATRATFASKPLLRKIETALFQIREGIERHHGRVG